MHYAHPNTIVSISITQSSISRLISRNPDVIHISGGLPQSSHIAQLMPSDTHRIGPFKAWVPGARPASCRGSVRNVIFEAHTTFTDTEFESEAWVLANPRGDFYAR